MKKTSITYLFYGLTILVSISCNKTLNNNIEVVGIKPSETFKVSANVNENIVDEYDNFWAREVLTRGDFNVQSSARRYFDVPSLVNAIFSGVCYGGELVSGPTLNTINNGSFYINDEKIDFINDEAKRYDYKRIEQNIFGRTNLLKLEGGEFEGFEYQIYLPSEIMISNPRPINDTSYIAEINAGENVTIQWNVDNQNDKGVVIQVTPQNYSQPMDNSKKGTTILTTDNGIYTLSSSDIEELGLNIGDNFSIRIYRGNFKLIPSTTNKEVYSFFAHTDSEVDVLLK